MLSVSASNQVNPIWYNANCCTLIQMNQLMQKGSMNCRERKGEIATYSCLRLINTGKSFGGVG